MSMKSSRQASEVDRTCRKFSPSEALSTHLVYRNMGFQ